MDVAIIFSGDFGERFVSNLVTPWLCPSYGACGIDCCDYCKRYDFSSKISSIIQLPEPAQLGIYLPVACKTPSVREGIRKGRRGG